ncbi:N-6 DNA methylase [Nonomuraea phyllanthi]|uniref:site-specific DNA-methyltransferase (adenine-specific) n=1 Tax=Nonomuraea phyllanthi TaxID=2219224 RepID=A0A5C4V0I5_9ACTN|nr:N-6 DNA methylase [Nonomuraea phyllanthi]KAB8183913.1 N-6 DNA methylase [Nonomuraea phyllanthi]
MSLAVGRLYDTVSDQELGTVFAVTKSLALTAFHCVGNRHTGKVEVQRLMCVWGTAETMATVSDADHINDVALLALTQALPSSLDPISLSVDIHEHEQYVAPGAPKAVKGAFLYAASGAIVWRASRLDDGAEALQLSCRDSTAGLSLHGLSGAPVLVGHPMRAAGLIMRNQPRDDRPDLATGATIYAAPAHRILAKWPQLHDHPVDISIIIKRLASRRATRRLEDVRDDILQLLQKGDLGLTELDLSDVRNSLWGVGFQVDIRIGRTVIDVRRDLTDNRDLLEAKASLEQYISAVQQRDKGNYLGLVTDGKEWHLHVWSGGSLRKIRSFSVTVGKKHDEVVSWLEAVLAVKQSLRPTPAEIEAKLGAESPSYALAATQLKSLYEKCREFPRVKVKRDMWAKLLTTASGTNFTDDDALFVNHTLLVAMADVIGHAVLGLLRPVYGQVTADSIMSGREFSNAQVGGVIESDFFDWVSEIPEGLSFIDDLIRRLRRFAWDEVEHDVLKTLYESIIPELVRHRLGEYYTPDWLAEKIVSDLVTDPLSQRVLDASCGSGTFIFHAVRQYVEAAEQHGLPVPDIIRGVTEKVYGFDVQPVAVTLARVTYLLAIGMRRLQADNRPRFTVPVYLCDSMRWGQEGKLWSYDGLSIPTTFDHAALLYDPDYEGANATDKLRFPDRIMANAGLFDQIVQELADKASQRLADSSVPPLNAFFCKYAIEEEDQAVLTQTFENMCTLHDKGRDHIWGYYVRNLARPIWLARPDNRADVLVGNPPWLAYRYMTDIQKTSFRIMCTDRGLWRGAKHTTNQDLSALFVVRCVELYLRAGGRFGYVMPLAALTGGQYRGFRQGVYKGQSPFNVRFEQAWDLSGIKPTFFKQAVGVVQGERMSHDRSPRALTRDCEEWVGRLQNSGGRWSDAEKHIRRNPRGSIPALTASSPYRSRFFEGATVTPRYLFFVEPEPAGPLGPGPGRRRVKSYRSPKEDKRWRRMESLRGVIESQFIQPIYLGDSLLPFRWLTPMEAVLPMHEQRLVADSEQPWLERYPGFLQWWRAAEDAWLQNRASDKMDLIDRLDYMKALSRQFPASGHRVAYLKSGMYLAAAIVKDNATVIDHSLYWGVVADEDEGRYLCSILNSMVTTMAVRHMQVRGEHNPRHFDKHVWNLPIPTYDPSDQYHRRLTTLAQQAESVVSEMSLPVLSTDALRRRVRQKLLEEGIAGELDQVVQTLLFAPDATDERGHGGVGAVLPP